MKALLNTEVLIALVGFAGVVIASGFGYLGRVRSSHRVEQVERELEFQKAALDFSEFLAEWNEVNHELISLFEDTSIDRFLLLRAWNGTLTPRWTTAFFQVRAEGQKPISYVHFDLDDDYVSRLREVVSTGSLVFSVDDAPRSDIKDVYQAEGVKQAAWFFIDRQQLADSNSSAITYCSFASHSSEPLSQYEQTRCRLIASRMKGVALSMNAGHK